MAIRILLEKLVKYYNTFQVILNPSTNKIYINLSSEY